MRRRRDDDTNNAVSSHRSHQQWIHRYFSVALPLWSFCARVRLWRYQNRIFRFWNNLIWITEQLFDKDKRISCRKIPYFKNSLYVIYWRLFFFCPCWYMLVHCLKITQIVICRIRIFEFWPIFFLLKLTCLVTLFDRKLQVFKNSPKWTISGIFN